MYLCTCFSICQFEENCSRLSGIQKNPLTPAVQTASFQIQGSGDGLYSQPIV
jgi:hypothetical protein